MAKNSTPTSRLPPQFRLNPRRREENAAEWNVTDNKTVSVEAQS